MDEKKVNQEVERYSLDIISAMAERVIRRLWVLIIVLVLLLAGTNLAWLWYINQYDFESYAVDIDTEGNGIANFIGNDGDIHNGENFGQEENQNA